MGRIGQILAGGVITGASYGFGHLRQMIDQVLAQVIGASGGGVQAPIDYALLLQYGQVIFFYAGIVIAGHGALMMMYGLVKKALEHSEPEPEKRPRRRRQPKQDGRFPDQEEFEHELEQSRNEQNPQDRRDGPRREPGRSRRRPRSQKPDRDQRRQDPQRSGREPKEDYEAQEGFESETYSGGSAADIDAFDADDDEDEEWEHRRVGDRRQRR